MVYITLVEMCRRRGQAVLDRSPLSKSRELTKFVLVLNLLAVDIILQVYPLGEKIS